MIVGLAPGKYKTQMAGKCIVCTRWRDKQRKTFRNSDLSNDPRLTWP
jgi:hypothetical protein